MEILAFVLSLSSYPIGVPVNKGYLIDKKEARAIVTKFSYIWSVTPFMADLILLLNQLVVAILFLSFYTS